MVRRLGFVRRCLAIVLSATFLLQSVQEAHACDFLASHDIFQHDPSNTASLLESEALIAYTGIGQHIFHRGSAHIVRFGGRIHRQLENRREGAASRRLQRAAAEAAYDREVENRGRRSFVRLAATAAAAIPVTAVLKKWMLPLSVRADGFDVAPANAWFDGQQLLDPITGAPTPLSRSFQSIPNDPRVPQTINDYLPDFANTYDNARFGLYLLNSGRADALARVQAMLAYYQAQGIPTRSNKEPFVFTGEAMWVGLLATQYLRMTGDDQFEPLLKNLDAYLLDTKMIHPAGGVYGTPGQTWVSTEHNLDVLRYLQNRYQTLLERNLPGDVTQANAVRARQLLVAKWLVNSAYVPYNPKDPVSVADMNQGRFLRGHNDAVFASDTHFWGIDILTGMAKDDPAFFKASGLNAIDLPRLMRVAEAKSRLVGYPYVKPDGSTVFLTGFRYQDSATNPGSPDSFEWTSMAVRAYQQLGEADHAAQILYGVPDTSVLVADPIFAGTDFSALPSLNGLSNALVTDADGKQSLAYAGEPGYPFSDNRDWFATAYPAMAATIWGVDALRNRPANEPFSFGAATPTKIPTTSYPATPANATPIIGVPNVTASDFVAADGTYDLSSVDSIRITFTPGSIGKYFYLRMVPQGAAVNDNQDDWVNSVPYQVPPQGYMDFPIAAFKDAAHPLLNGQSISDSQMKNISRISIHSGAAPFNGRFVIAGQSAADVVSFYRMQGLAPAPTAPPENVLKIGDNFRRIPASDNFVNYIQGVPDLTSVQTIRITVDPATPLGTKVLVRILPKGADAGQPNYLNKIPYPVQVDPRNSASRIILVPMSDFTASGTNLVGGLALTTAQLKSPAEVDVYSGKIVWGTYSINNTNIEARPTLIEGILAATPPPSTVTIRTLANSPSGNNSNASWLDQSSLDISGFQSLRFYFDSSQKGKKFILRLLPKNGDYSSEAYVRDQPYTVPSQPDASGKYFIDVPMTDFTQSNLHLGRPLNATELKQIVQISLHAGDNPWGDHALGQPANTVVLFNQLDAYIPAAGTTANQLGANQSESLSYSRSDAILERMHREASEYAYGDLAYLAAHGAIPLALHRQMAKESLEQRRRSAGVHEMTPKTVPPAAHPTQVSRRERESA